MNNNPQQIYIQALLKLVDVPAIKARKLTVLMDPVNGATSEVLEELLKQVGVKIVKINWQMDRLPEREPEPRKKTLEKTSQAVVKNQCDLGVATDMDGDRVLFIDELGEVLSEDLTAATFVEQILTHSTSLRVRPVCVTPINSSGLFKKVVEKAGGKLVECRVGPPEICQAIKKEKAVFAYEESGKYFFSQYYSWADGLLAAIKMLEILAVTKKSLSEIRLSYPPYFQVKLAVECPVAKMPKQWIGLGEKKFFGDSFRFIRASGTEPLIRIFSDSPSLAKAQALAIEGKKIVEKKLCAE